jgi:hypothetical protein
MAITYDKLNDRLKVTETVEQPQVKETLYDLRTLKHKEAILIKQRDAMMESKNTEISKVQELIRQAESLGLKESPIQSRESGRLSISEMLKDRVNTKIRP